MQSLGAEHEVCDGCNKQFSRGEQMATVTADDGERMGWFCDGCIEEWKQAPKKFYKKMNSTIKELRGEK